MNAPKKRWITLAALLCAGCGGAAGPGADTGSTADAGRDATTQDQATAEMGVDTIRDTGRDTGQPDAIAPDAIAPDAIAPDAAGADAMAPDLAAPCNYIQGGASDTHVAQCGSSYKVVLQYSSKLGPPKCPTYWIVGGVTSTVGAVDAAAVAGCNTTCLWTFSKAVLVLRCGQKLGYEVLVAPGGCKDLYKYPDGYYESTAAYDKAHPCP